MCWIVKKKYNVALDMQIDNTFQSFHPCTTCFNIIYNADLKLNVKNPVTFTSYMELRFWNWRADWIGFWLIFPTCWTRPPLDGWHFSIVMQGFAAAAAILEDSFTDLKKSNHDFLSVVEDSVGQGKGARWRKNVQGDWRAVLNFYIIKTIFFCI